MVCRWRARHHGDPMGETVQVDLWHQSSAVRAGALITSSWSGRNATLSLDAPDLSITLTAAGRDLFDALQQLRLQLEPLGWFPLCNGSRIDCYPSGMARDMGGASSLYELGIGKADRFPLVGLFEPAPPDKVGTVTEQDAYFGRWIRGPKSRD
jgi:hypothetical protein